MLRLASFLLVLLTACGGAQVAPSPLPSPSAQAVSDPQAGEAWVKSRPPISNASLEVALPHDALVTEDIAYDGARRTFFVSSVRRRKILAIGADGHARDLFVGGPGVTSICGLALAPDAKRLWATTAAMPIMIGYDPHASTPTALLAIDPRDGSLLERIDLDARDRRDTRDAGSAKHALTDLAVGTDGTVFVSDSAGGAVYALPPGAHALVQLAGPDVLASPQTPAPTPDGKRLFVADYARGIAAIDLATHALTWLGHADGVVLAGIDGLYYDGATFLAVQNGVLPPRVVRFVPSADGTQIARADVLERSTPGLGEPTHGVLAGGMFYFLANAGWNRYGDDGALLANAPPDAPAIWRLTR